MFDYNKEIYISIDVETDGPIPGENSMLSLGAAAFAFQQHYDEVIEQTHINSTIWYTPELINTFSCNLHLLPNAKQNKSTMEFWNKNQQVYDETRKSLIFPEVGMQNFYRWIRDLEKLHKKLPVVVAYPAGFDFTWVYWYLMKYVGNSPFSFSAVDIKTLAMTHLKCNYRDATKKNFPTHWFSKSPHTHIAVDDAIEQGELFCNILKEVMR